MSVNPGQSKILACAILASLSAGQARAADAIVSAIEEIIVTAQRREERLQDVPISIAVQSAEQLENAVITNLRDVTLLTPGLTVTGTGANIQPVIRGVQSAQTDPGNDPNVSVYLDGVYQANQISNNFELADVRQIEVLKGPQGTLFGRNATGGAIRVFTLDPEFETTGKLSLDYGRFNDITAKAYLSGPLSGDTLAGSLSVFYEDRDGYHKELLSGQDDYGGLESKTARGKLLYKPSDSSSFLLTLAYMDRYDGDSTTYGARNGNSIGRLFGATLIGDQPFEFVTNRDAFADSTVFSASLKADFELGGGTLTSITAYNDTDVLYTQDADFSDLDLLYYALNESQEDFSEELTYTTPQFDRWSATFGAFYYHGDGAYDPLEVRGSFFTVDVQTRQVTDAYAAFGEVNFDLTDRLSLIAGLRYSYEEKEASGLFTAPGTKPDLPKLGDESWDSVTPRLSLQYRAPSDDNYYVTYSEGFKSGGFNIALASPDPFDQEEVKALEVGVKTSPRRTISANAALFAYRYTDIQVQTIVDNFNVTANAASADIYGIDGDMTARVTDNFTLTLGASYLDATFDEYPDAVVLVPIGGPDCRCGNTNTTIDASGNKMPKAPEWTASLVADYSSEFDFGLLQLSAMLFASDSFYWDTNQRVREDSYTTVAARASWRPVDSSFKLSVWGRNLTDEEYTKTSFILEGGDGVTYAMPRSYGVGIEYNF